MATSLKNRKLRVTFHMPGGDVVLNETLWLRVRVRKDCLSSQNEAVIEVGNLPQQFRNDLMSQFTALNRRKTAAGQIAPVYIDMEIAAGYVDSDGKDSTATIYHGQVVECNLISGPPNIIVRIKCYTHQVDKTTYIDQPPPYNSTFREVVFWAGGQMGFDSAHIKCDTKYDSNIIGNAGRSTVIAGDLPLYLEQFYSPDVAVFIDDNFLIVKNRYEVLNPSDVVTLNEFIGIPCWNEWGVEGTVFFDSALKVVQAAKFESILNPSIDGTFVIMSLDYDLTSRDTPFYCHVSASPAA
jgi:hypothetical protein